jgi:leucyl-tRNA synthetase
VWRLAMDSIEKIKGVESFSGPASDIVSDPAKKLYIKANQTIKKVTQDIDKSFHFNTAISAVMELVNDIYAINLESADTELKRILLFSLENILLLLSPIVPHFCEEIFEKLGNKGSILLQPWPEYRGDSLESGEMTVVVQINGKLRSTFILRADSDESVIKEAALSDEKINKYIGDKKPKKVIVITKKQTLVNIVV